ncbi:U-box domain-containing protein 44 [Apostasia shenzhenica]|uniref:RING-type E3 ubiquitin transferase n=1 Tax=Apostasia shenzhenica TaxID=1088818 RepID=A0A2I0A8K3_9ASPA|nr:U-box domain-containing protein 44 [Apostasia shenzhenica]
MNSTAASPPAPPPPPLAAAAAALDSIVLTLAEICAAEDDDYAWDPPRRFTSCARRLQLLAQQLATLADLSSPAAITALRGISGELEASRAALSAYRRPSRILVLINCLPLCASIRSHASAIASSLALIDPALSTLPDLRKKAADLSRDLLQSDLRVNTFFLCLLFCLKFSHWNLNKQVTDMEERVYRTLQKEAELRPNSKAVQSAIIMDLARALGADPGDHARLSEHIRQLRSDLAGSSSVAERKILMSLEKIFDSWSTEPIVATASPDADFEENAQISPFKSFICPLTKEVMKDPVVLESLQTYDRSAIEKWFERCRDDGRVPTCPMTGQEQLTLDLKRNIGLAGAIEEWVNRNIEAQIKVALHCLGEGGLNSEESVGKVLDSVYGISEEHPEFRYRIRNAGIVDLVMRMLKEQSKNMGSHLRWKTLMTMHSMARDEESKLIMLKESMTRLAIRSLSETSEKEKEYALRILLHFSYDEEFSSKLAQEKGALCLLISIAGNSDQPTLSNLAEDILKNTERIEGNVEFLATEGRYYPLLKRLCEGTEEDRMEMAKLIGKMNLTNSGKEYIARKGGKVLVCMLPTKIDGAEASLEALYNLSSFSDNAAILVGQGLLPALVEILFLKQLEVSSNMEELAAQITARIVANPGHWETSFADKEGHEMQSEFMIHKLLGVLETGSCKYKAAILHILGGITTSPKTSELAAAHIKRSNGIQAIIPYINNSEDTDTCRAPAFRLLSLLSEKLGQDLIQELRALGKLPFLKERLLDSQYPIAMKTDIVYILSNLPFSEEEVKNILGPDLLTWAVNNLKMQRSYSIGKHSKVEQSMIEALLGLLLHYARSHDPNILSLVQETHLLSIYRKQLGNHSNCRAKQRGSLGLKCLSESAGLSTMIRDSEPQPPSGFCAPLILLCRKSRMASVPCSLHNTVCAEDSSFCLLKGKAIKPLIDLMEDDSVDVQIAAVEALSTLVSDNLRRAAVEILNELGLCKAAFSLVKEAGSGGLQERVVFMVDKLLQVKSLSEEYSMDPDLVKALVEALKNGNANAKGYAQNALKNLNKISGIGGRTST